MVIDEYKEQKFITMYEVFTRFHYYYQPSVHMSERVIIAILSICLSVCHTLILENTKYYGIRYGLTQNDYLRIFIVLLLNFKVIFEIK